ncbi:MAG: hypothetical protein ACRDF0_00470 [Candidatus Limnocylindria bacterium]
MRKIGLTTLLVTGLMLWGLAGPAAAQETCVVVDTSTEEVIPGVTLTWDSSFLCANAPDSGTYTFTVEVTNHEGSAEAVTIDDLELTHATPRPRGSGPAATGEAAGLPLTLAPGETGSFTVSGTYTLVETDEGKKANLHFQAFGHGVDSGETFALGINAHIRAPGATEEGGTGDLGGSAERNGSAGQPTLAVEPTGPPSWASGPPPWAAQGAAARGLGR